MAGSPETPGSPPAGNPWFLAIRPRTLPAAVVPVLVGSAVAFSQGVFAPLPALAALVGALFLQIGSNLANDVYDFKKGADTAERVGPTRVTQAGLLSAKEVLTGMWTVFALATLVGVYLAWVGGWPIVAIGLSSIVAAIAYTGGPFPLGYKGLGELFVFLFFGVIAVSGTYYVQAGTLSPTAVLAGIPIGLLCANILVVNNVRDIETDRKAGKQTLAARFGRKFGVGMYLLFLCVSLGIPVGLAASGLYAPLATLLTAPIGFGLYQRLNKLSGPPLNAVLGATAQYELLYGLVFAACLATGR